ncbi:hypothetical protein RRG08_023276 [Elysia crispata]|uniref:Uncharacterized protein n=1 Tax=Elysia crispata TaxID=231223 RepID=A0AAE0YXD7_9GAST|nr:hypothetical protein RRG08_023276 [Elysia crispata]
MEKGRVFKTTPRPNTPAPRRVSAHAKGPSKLDCQAKIRLKIQRPKDQSPPFLAITVQYLNYQGHGLTQELTVISNERSFLFLHMII